MSTATIYDSLTEESLFDGGVLLPALTYYWDVTVFDKGGLEAASPIHSFRKLLAGDLNRDALITASDVIFLVNYVFKGGVPPDPPALGDVDASCAVTSADIIHLVNFVFRTGPPPQAGCATASARRDVMRPEAVDLEAAEKVFLERQSSALGETRQWSKTLGIMVRALR